MQNPASLSPLLKELQRNTKATLPYHADRAEISYNANEDPVEIRYFRSDVLVKKLFLNYDGNGNVTELKEDV